MIHQEFKTHRIPRTYYINFITGELRCSDWSYREYSYDRLLNKRVTIEHTEHENEKTWISFTSSAKIILHDCVFKITHYLITSNRHVAPVKVYLTEEQQRIRTAELVKAKLQQAP